MRGDEYQRTEGRRLKWNCAETVRQRKERKDKRGRSCKKKETLEKATGRTKKKKRNRGKTK